MLNTNLSWNLKNPCGGKPLMPLSKFLMPHDPTNIYNHARNDIGACPTGPMQNQVTQNTLT
jgi:hypothetical protein